MTTPTLSDILAILDEIAPFSLAESWDNVGLMIGAPDQPVQGIHLGLDPTLSMLEETAAHSANVLITHHPFIFKGLRSIRTDLPAGRFLMAALEKQLAVIGVHTNLDVIAQGVSFALASRFNLTELKPLTRAKGTETHQVVGFGQIGVLPSPVTGEAFMQIVSKALALPVVLLAGNLPETIKKVAVCGGSGSDLAQEAFSEGADIYVTAEVKHSIARWAEEAGYCVIDAGHFATEQCILQSLAAMLRQALKQHRFDVAVSLSENEKSPFRYYINKEEKLINI